MPRQAPWRLHLKQSYLEDKQLRQRVIPPQDPAIDGLQLRADQGCSFLIIHERSALWPLHQFAFPPSRLKNQRHHGYCYYCCTDACVLLHTLSPSLFPTEFKTTLSSNASLITISQVISQMIQK
ncbi:hypothetical protein X798_04920 [Onchocerca flexuosa]|uniref:Uncharacterized protein n=2 Tax=Onchocerca flexuosa TaxID=387005 RepID=A0A183I5M5_9BILA|nr:hypothetical protein X798_04920 [Onchocerca flexuosa]VDP20109.1 unnamed protein product [Onchocerca flexuosa]